MIEYIQGDILKADVEALVNPVNCVGVMGAGLAFQFKEAYPRNYRIYKKACEEGQVVLGHMFTTAVGMYNPKYIINFPTKNHWRDSASYEFIQSGMGALLQEVRIRGALSVAIPALGCGLGGLEWIRVKDILESYLIWSGEIRAVVYEPR